VRFTRGSLAPNLPHADLWVSQEHALLIDGLLIRAIELVNGMSITIDPCESLPEIEYLHIKLANPDDFIFAEGVGSETLVFNDRLELRGFDNGEEYRRLYGLPEIGRRGDVIAFYRSRDRMKSHLRSALSPWIDRRTAFDRVRDRLQERADLAA
jgi:Hint domain